MGLMFFNSQPFLACIHLWDEPASFVRIGLMTFMMYFEPPTTRMTK